MPKTERHGPRDVSGMEFYDLESFDVFSFCPDSNDASTPATQVHVAIQMRAFVTPLVMRYHGPGSLDAHIKALIEHRTYVFGRRSWPDDYPEQVASSDGT